MPKIGSHLQIRIFRERAPNFDTRHGVMMTSLPETWLCVLQDADDNEETELLTIERVGDGARR